MLDRSPDFAQNIRLQDGRVGSFRAMEQMLDRIEFLQDLRGMSAISKEGIVNAQSMWTKLTGANAPKGDAKYAQEILAQMKNENFNAHLKLSNWCRLTHVSSCRVCVR